MLNVFVNFGCYPYAGVDPGLSIVHRRGPPPSHPVTTMKLFTALAAITLSAAPAQAGGYEQAYAGGALYAATCAVMKGRINTSQAGVVVATVLRKKGINASYASDPMAQKVARQMYVEKGGCR